jgi:hypothetical protein
MVPHMVPHRHILDRDGGVLQHPWLGGFPILISRDNNTEDDEIYGFGNTPGLGGSQS